MADRIVLAERLDTGSAVTLAADLSKLPTDARVVLDASGVTHFGAQAVQVILSAARTFHAGGGALECADCSERAETQLAAMGLSGTRLTEVTQ